MSEFLTPLQLLDFGVMGAQGHRECKWGNIFFWKELRVKRGQIFTTGNLEVE